jgi:hypothetical protein
MGMFCQLPVTETLKFLLRGLIIFQAILPLVTASLDLRQV